MKLFNKLKDLDVISDYKDYRELIWLRAVKVNGKIIDNPDQEIKGNEEITVGILSID